MLDLVLGPHLREAQLGDLEEAREAPQQRQRPELRPLDLDVSVADEGVEIAGSPLGPRVQVEPDVGPFAGEGVERRGARGGPGDVALGGLGGQSEAGARQRRLEPQPGVGARPGERRGAGHAAAGENRIDPADIDVVVLEVELERGLAERDPVRPQAGVRVDLRVERLVAGPRRRRPVEVPPQGDRGRVIE